MFLVIDTTPDDTHTVYTVEVPGRGGAAPTFRTVVDGTGDPVEVARTSRPFAALTNHRAALSAVTTPRA